MRQTAISASITSDVGSIFHPLFWTFAQVLAFFYSLIPNYIIAITLLTVLVMLLTAPLTIKSTKSMVEMQRVQPEFRKIQQKYKGDREKLNEEVMKLYREHGVSPVGGCLPLLLQMPFFVCLYGVIKGLTNTKTVTINHIKMKVPSPRYLSSSTRMYQDILHAGGKIKSFGIDLSQTPFTHHGSIGASIPYYVLFFAAIGLQYMQMARLNKRNAANIQNNPQMQTMQTMQKVTPLIFGVIYIAFPIGVTVYFIVSSFCRIVIQEILFRTGVTAPKPAGQGGDRALPAPRRRGLMDRLADAQATAQEQRRRQAEMNGTINAISRDATPRDAISRDATPRRGAEEDADADEPGSAGSAKPTPPSNQGRPRKAQSLQPGTRTPAEKSDNGTNGTSSTQRGQSATKGNGRPPRASGGNGSTANGRTGPRTHSEDEDEAAKPKQVPPRSKDKRPRKAR